MNKSLTSTLKYAVSSEKKMNLVAKMVRWKDVSQAAILLQHMPKKSAKIILKVLNSAIANAKNNEWLNESDLYVSRVDIGKWMRLKRVRFASRSRVHSYVKYRSFIRVVLDTK